MDGYDWIQNEEAKSVYLNIVENIDDNSIIARKVGEDEKVSEVLIDVNCDKNTYMETMYIFYNDIDEYEKCKNLYETMDCLTDANDEAFYIVYEDGKVKSMTYEDENSYIFSQVKYTVARTDMYQGKWKQ